MFSKPLQILISGTAGQGAVTAGILLADAAVRGGKIASLTSITGAAVRYGESEAHVSIATSFIDYPYVEAPHALIALSQGAVDNHASALLHNGLVLFDPDSISFPATSDCRKYPMQALAALQKGELKDNNVNMVLIGAISVLSGIVSEQHLEDALKHHSFYTDQIKSALFLGMELTRHHRGEYIL